MKTIPAQLVPILDKRVTQTCFLVKLVGKKSGNAYGFTSLDAPVTFDDGFHALTYSPQNTLFPKNIEETSSMDVDNTEVAGWFTDAIRLVVDSGELLGAEATIYRVAYLQLDAGAEVVMYGAVGKVSYETNPNSPRNVEIKGLDHFLKVRRNTQYSITCRNTFGDYRCGKPFVWFSGAVGTVYDAFLMFQATGFAQADGYFDSGVVRFDTGDNAGVELEIETWKGGVAKLSFAPPFPVSPLDQVSFRKDCNKFAVTCFTDYNNMINFNGEHLTPVQDQSLMVPGAYIKSNNAL